MSMTPVEIAVVAQIVGLCVAYTLGWLSGRSGRCCRKGEQ